MGQHKRDIPSGAIAGLGVGIGVAIVLLVLVIIFFFVHLRRRGHSKLADPEQGILQNQTGTTYNEKTHQTPPQISTIQPPNIPRRNKSVKDRLMGPLYHDSMIDMASLPKARVPGATSSRRHSIMTAGDGDSIISKPWAENSPRPSFSSRRATRIMMMM